MKTKMRTSCNSVYPKNELISFLLISKFHKISFLNLICVIILDQTDKGSNSSNV